MDIDPATLRWRSSSTSPRGEADRVEVAVLPDGGWAVRNGADGDEGDILWFTPGEVRAFVLGVRDGEFDI
ncbi:MAG: DUF397 domain-containing protein [Pseudonocardia sp.]|nr:DUF397 domain-containing protein [Pseudonocardia sp.]